MGRWGAGISIGMFYFFVALFGFKFASVALLPSLRLLLSTYAGCYRDRSLEPQRLPLPRLPVFPRRFFR